MTTTGVLVRDPILRMPQVMEETGLARSTIYKRIKAGEFPEGTDLGGGIRGWPLSELQRWKAGLQKARGPNPHRPKLNQNR